MHGVYSVGSPRFNLCALDEAHPECPSLRNQFSTKWVKPQPAEGISVVRIFRVEVRRTRFAYTADERCPVVFPVFENREVLGVIKRFWCGRS